MDGEMISTKETWMDCITKKKEWMIAWRMVEESVETEKFMRRPQVRLSIQGQVDSDEMMMYGCNHCSQITMRVFKTSTSQRKNEEAAKLKKKMIGRSIVLIFHSEQAQSN